MIKLKQGFQTHANLYTKSQSIISIDEIIKHISLEKDDILTNCRLVKISQIEVSKRLLQKGLITNYKLDNKKIKDNNLDTLPDVIKYRELKENYTKHKTKLPIILNSIHTSDGLTNKGNIEYYNNHIIIDLDELTLQGFKADDIIDRSIEDDFCLLSFISPGGDGVKLLYKVNLERELSASKLDSFHIKSFDIVSKYVSNFYNIDIDKSGDNINRSCFLTKGYRYNYNSEAFEVDTYTNWVEDNKNNKPVSNKPVSNKPVNNNSISYLINEFTEFFDKNPTDLFSDRNIWVKLSYVIVYYFGSNGIKIFQKLSTYATNYNFKACEKLYNNSLKTLQPDRLGKYPDRWLYKILTDNGFIPKTTDRILKKFKWNESDYNIMRNELGFNIIEDEITGEFYIESNNKMEPLIDSNYNQLITDLRLNYNTLFKENILRTYIFSLDNIIKRNFIKEKIDSLTYKKSDEFEKIFKYIETDDDELFKKIFFRWCLGSIQNIYDTYYDEILVLKSKQGVGKTTWILNHLTSPFSKWTTTSFNYDLKNKDDMKLLADKMFIYDTENISMKKAENQVIKRITSTATVDYRRPYDKFSITKKRIATFIMDTNEDIIFNDLTGGRRFLILTINSMNIYEKDGAKLKEIDYEKVWGYVINQYKLGKRANNIEIENIDEHTDQYRLKSDLENIIDDLFEITKEFNLTFNDIKNILVNHYNNNNDKLITDGYTDTRLGRILSKKCDVKIKKIKGKTTRLYNLDKSTNIDLYKTIDSGQTAINDILDKMTRDKRGPNEKEIEILQKLKPTK